MEDLQQAILKVGQLVYSQSGGGEGAPPEGGDPPEGDADGDSESDGTVEGEYREV